MSTCTAQRRITLHRKLQLTPTWTTLPKRSCFRAVPMDSRSLRQLRTASEAMLGRFLQKREQSHVKHCGNYQHIRAPSRPASSGIAQVCTSLCHPRISYRQSLTVDGWAQFVVSRTLHVFTRWLRSNGICLQWFVHLQEIENVVAQVHAPQRGTFEFRGCKPLVYQTW